MGSHRRGPPGEGEAWRYLGLLVLGTIPAVVVGLGAKDILESLFEVPEVVGFALLVTGAFLWTSRSAMARDPKANPSLRTAVVMGLAQAFAIIPGISRSGATVVAGLWMGVEAEEAAAFSFLMAIPVILGAAVLELPDLVGGGTAPVGEPAGLGGLPVGPLLLGSAVAAVAGILAIWTFVVMLKRRSFYLFGPYCWGVGGLFLLYLFLRG